MKKLLAVCAALAFIIACSSDVAETKTDSAASCKKPVNPNGDSELALLMRVMANYNDSVKAALLSNRTVPEPPAAISTLLTAKRTDPDLDEQLFSSGANQYLAQVEQFKNAGKDDQVRFYNGIVNACVSCHHNFCGGPLVRINKMFIAEK